LTLRRRRSPASRLRLLVVLLVSIMTVRCRLRLKRHLSEHEKAPVSPVDATARAYDGWMANVVVIEDEPGIVDFIQRGLTARGFTILAARDGVRGLELALGERVDLVVLDLMLPSRSGEEILHDLNEQRPGLPVIVLTAKGEVEDRVNGLRAGAVDYLVKPFALAELDARIHAQLRAARQAPTTSLRRAGLSIDLISRRVTHDGDPVRLTTTEFDLLVYLVRNAGQVLTRQQILRAVWGYDHDPATNNVDVYVGYLRRKLTGADRRTVTITTVRSRGYRLEDPA
jgi:DNA-binding response OmpR family regulator